METLRTVVSVAVAAFLIYGLTIASNKFGVIMGMAFAYIWFMVARAYERRFDPVSTVAKVIWIFAPYLAFGLQIAVLWWFQLTYGPEPEMSGQVGAAIQAVVVMLPFILIILDVIISKLFD